MYWKYRQRNGGGHFAHGCVCVGCVCVCVCVCVGGGGGNCLHYTLYTETSLEKWIGPEARFVGINCHSRCDAKSYIAMILHDGPRPV